MNSKALLTTLILLSSSSLIAEENPQIQQLMTAIEQLNKQISVLQANNEKNGLQKQVSQLADQIQHFHLESIKRNDQELAAIQADFKKQIEGIRKEIAMSQDWENKAFGVLSKALEGDRKSSEYTTDNSTDVKSVSQSTKAEQPRSGNFYNSSGRPQVKNGQDLFVMADWLIWQASEQNLDAWQVGGYSTGVGVDAQPGPFKSPRFDWESGVRVAVGYNIGHDQWDLSLIWTWFEDDASKRSAGTLQNPVFDAIGDPVFGVTALSGSTNLNLHLNIIDLDLGKEFQVTKWLTLRPVAGVRTTWINQHWRTRYNNVIFASYGGAISEFKVNQTQKFWGIGARGGLDAEFGLIDGFSIFSNTSLDLLYGIFKINQTNSSVSTQNIKTTNLISSRNEHSAQAVADIQLGLRWDWGFAQDRFHIRLQGGWENHIFFDQNHFYYTVTARSNIINRGGNLDFQGWFLSGRFDF
jgi:hypothetical protein